MISVKESIKLIRTRGVDLAVVYLWDRGLRFSEAISPEGAEKIVEEDVMRFYAEQDPVGMASCLMQCVNFPISFDLLPFCNLLSDWGLDLYYKEHNPEASLQWMQLSCGLLPTRTESIRGVLSVCLTGEIIRPEIALPYMVILSHLDPSKDEVHYVLKLLLEKKRRLVPPKNETYLGIPGNSELQNSEKWDKKCWKLYYSKEIVQLDCRLAEQEYDVDPVPENHARLLQLRQRASELEKEFRDHEWSFWSI
ncbi:hypothetical protein L0222_12825 [bacterium]|nr:hypothetical protein [bacterium]MCI0606182.1 hypothetical protein [bacterium]